MKIIQSILNGGFLLMASTILLFSSCNRKNDAASSPAPASVYSYQWYSTMQNANDSCYFKNGGFYISNQYHTDGSSIPIASVVNSRFNISGDCEVKIKFSNFNPTGTTILSDAVNISFSGKGILKPLVTMLLSNGYLSAQDTLNSKLPKSSYSKQGEAYFKRVGNSYTSWFRAGSDTVFCNIPNYPSNDLGLTIGVIAAQANNPVKSASLQIDEISVYDASGKLIIDPLNVNSIKYY
jgi:hypothetical protein